MLFFQKTHRLSGAFFYALGVVEAARETVFSVSTKSHIILFFFILYIGKKALFFTQNCGKIYGE